MKCLLNINILVLVEGSNFGENLDVRVFSKSCLFASSKVKSLYAQFLMIFLIMFSIVCCEYLKYDMLFITYCFYERFQVGNMFVAEEKEVEMVK